ncbi:hypothetical protein INQ41_12960 [Lysobacter ciconiae]|uniref:DUF2489 domain-containing protein n=1 Tax=Novilysobacter ciconiae TaxID=2781022 RepID=A0A7S6UFT2_9GAMM|nr:hypothetical protein [Lysobacter ciconiae]QOW19496.1 hypothetical protein INQ41_12960 [Lysobacter ciconiae]
MQQLLEEIAKLLPVLVGALIALLGAAARYFVERRDKRMEVRRQKLERLTDLTYRIRAWTGSLDSKLAFGLEGESQVDSPIEELQVLADIYFPELHDPASRLVVAAKTYAAMAYRMGARRLQDGRIPDDANMRIQETYAPVADAIGELSKQIRLAARKLE